MEKNFAKRYQYQVALLAMPAGLWVVGMSLTSRTKCFIRRGSIIAILFIYIGVIFVNVLGYGITRKYTDILNGKTITIEACNAVVAEFDEYYDSLLVISLPGYLISTLLILIIFKKVR
ncbi:hypothetical protein JHU04_002586 [Brenneria sp. 4F2]|nr:hypothetical protein [Brenneria bubanii]